MKSIATMKLLPCLVAAPIAALLLTSLPAFAQSDEGSFGETSSDGSEADGSTSGSVGGSFGAEGSVDAAGDADAAVETEASRDSERNDETSERAESATALEASASDDEASSGYKQSTGPDSAGPNETQRSGVGFAMPVKTPRFENSTMTLHLGLIAQPQLDISGAPDAEKTTKNLYLRRAGLLVYGSVLDTFDYFFTVDYPNLFKVDPTNQTGGTGKNAPGLNVQDVIVTYRALGDTLKVDAGFMLPPLSHNALQGAAWLYGPDYFVNSFRRNVLSSLDPFSSNGQSPAGRDAGVQLRGLVLNDHLEYRVGLFQGLRVGPLPAAMDTEAEVGGVNFFRVAARLQVNLLDAVPDFFYQGTYLGTKEIVSFGAFYDFQDEYRAMGGDVFVDLPVGPGIVTAQANVVLWDGGNFIQALSKHTAIMAEAGYLIRPLMLSPILRFERLISDELTAALPSEDRYGGGLAFWPFGHNSNIKAFFTRVHRVPAPEDFNQVNVQWQLYF